MKRLHILSLTCVCLGIAAVLLFRASTHAIAATPSSCGSWNVVHSLNGANTENYLFGVATISANDIWTVGDEASQTLTEHWNGAKWSIVHSPNPSSIEDGLAAVTDVSTNNVWAVGWTLNSSGNTETLIEHWNGSTWSIVSNPSPYENNLYGVAAVSPNDIWAVGRYETNNGGLQALIEHWNGSQWSVVTAPANNAALYSVTVLSTSDVWAVGDYNFNAQSYSVVEHWDGSQWSVVHSPNPSSYRRIALFGVAAVSATNIWAVGSYGSNSFFGATLIEHWNGKKWSIVPGAPTSERVELDAVAVLSPTNIWAVGPTYDGATFIEHWDGSTWSIVPSPNPGVIDNEFYAVASIPGSNYVWAVGYTVYAVANNDLLRDTLTAYYC